MSFGMGTVRARPGGGAHASVGGSPERVLSALVLSAAISFATSVTLFAVMLALGPSAGEPQNGRGGPIWFLSVKPSVTTVTTLQETGLLLGALAVITGIAAVGRGWRPSPWLLIGAGTVAVAVFIFLPTGSIDDLNYAIYGRIAALGHNPYVMTPAQLYRSGDPVGLLAPTAWRHGPTAYGPVATAIEWAAAKLGGASMARIVFWIRLFFGVSFIATAVGLVRLAGRDRARQARACLLWATNPLMLFWLVGSGHNDVLLALLAVLAMMTIQSRYGSGIIAGAVTGLIIGAGIAIKTPFALVGLGLAWPARKSPPTIVAGLVGAAAVLVPSYMVPGVMNAGGLGDRLTLGAGFTRHVPVAIKSRPVVYTALVAVATLAMVLLLLRRLPPGHRALPAVRPATALVLGWLAVFPIQAPWYDGLLFPLLALMVASRLDYLLIARCLLISPMWLPGLGPAVGLDHTFVVLSNFGVIVLFVVLIVMCLRFSWGATLHTVRVEPVLDQVDPGTIGGDQALLVSHLTQVPVSAHRLPRRPLARRRDGYFE